MSDKMSDNKKIVRHGMRPFFSNRKDSEEKDFPEESEETGYINKEKVKYLFDRPPLPASRLVVRRTDDFGGSSSTALPPCSPPNSPESVSSNSIDFSFLDSADVDIRVGNLDDDNLDDVVDLNFSGNSMSQSNSEHTPENFCDDCEVDDIHVSLTGGDFDDSNKVNPSDNDANKLLNLNKSLAGGKGKSPIKGRRSFVDKARCDRKRIRALSRNVEGSPAHAKHLQQKKERIANIRASRTNETHKSDNRSINKKMKTVKARKTLFTVRKNDNQFKKYNLIGLNREMYNHIISNPPSVVLSEATYPVNPNPVQSGHQNQNARANPFTRDRRTFRHRNIARAQITNEYPPRVNFGTMSDPCPHCGSLNFLNEKFNCCQHGKVVLPPLPPTPDPLKNLYDFDSPYSRDFMKNIRKYNTLFSFASTKLFNKHSDLATGRGPPTIRICGQYRHRIGGLHPGEGFSRKFNQLYFYSGDEAIFNRQQASMLLYDIALSREVLQIIQMIMDTNNPYAEAYKHMYQVENEEVEAARANGTEIPKVFMQFLHGPDRRRYNAPAVNEVAAIFSSRDWAPPPREFVLHSHQYGLQDINYLNPHLDNLSYPLLFPCGGTGFRLNIPHSGPRATQFRNKITMREFYNYRICERNEFNCILQSGLLFQQFLVDAFCKIEQNNLNFIRKNQDKLYVENYSGLLHYLERQRTNNNAGAVGPGRVVILPSSHEGSPRAMRELYMDAMSAVAQHGKPSVFVTVTCNPKWPEIELMRRGRKASDIPHIEARVFKMYLRDIKHDLWVNGVAGKTIHNLHVIEFQKRGLPHAHILLKFSAEDEVSTADDVDSLVCAEIPDKDLFPNLHKTITNCMLHGPCNDRCLVDGVCSKGYPKDFCETTKITPDSYPQYRRRNLPDREFKKNNSPIPFDNRDVVPYNPYLSQKYNCHINFEICNSIKAIKYLHKYVYKGYDCASVKLTEVYNHDEISDYVNGRYVGAPEAAWKIQAFPMHDQSHSVFRLSVHDKNMQNVYFAEGEEVEAVERSANRKTHLQAWFELNQVDPSARQYLYTEIPLWYRWEDNQWKKRKRKISPFQLVRLYSVSPRDQSRFYLRLLLLHVKGAKSFEDLKTVKMNGVEVEHDSYKQAAIALGLAEDDRQWRQTLIEASQSQMPRQLRSLFAFLLVYCHVRDGRALWEEFSNAMCEDLSRRGRGLGWSTEYIENLALRHIQNIVEGNGLSMDSFDLPCSNLPADNAEVQIEEVRGSFPMNPLTDDQERLFQAVTTSLDDYLIGNDKCSRMFYVDGPGGSGKTYLYNFLSNYFEGRGVKISMSAWTGVAATLLRKGKTVHSTFKIPLNANSESSSLMKRDSEAFENLRQTSIFIIDEVSMMDIDSFNVIDRLLREVTGHSNVPFGGKIIIFGGDFRQTLPIVIRGRQADIIEHCVKSSPLWALCRKFKLSKNIRAEEDSQFADFVLSVGNNTCPQKTNQPFQGCIKLPSEIVVPDVIDSIFPENIDSIDAQERVILTPRNDTSLRVNNLVLERQEGEMEIILSADSAECENPGDETMFPSEYLNSLDFSGLPPHVLKLKVGCVVMLLRNLHTEGGLCNGSRLIVREVHNRYLVCETMLSRRLVFIPKIQLSPARNDLPFKLNRVQFPVRLAYCITINKSQGQTLNYAGVLLEKPVFGHGQLYVALSRAKSFQNLKVEIREVSNCQGYHENYYFTENIVYQEIVEDL